MKIAFIGPLSKAGASASALARRIQKEIVMQGDPDLTVEAVKPAELVDILSENQSGYVLVLIDMSVLQKPMTVRHRVVPVLALTSSGADISLARMNRFEHTALVTDGADIRDKLVPAIMNTIKALKPTQ